MAREDPEAVRAEVRRLLATFGSPEGGLLLHGEVDRAFSFANLEALYSEVFARG